jgi:WD40 repeat protein
MYELANGSLETRLECKALRPNGIKCATFGASRIEARTVATGDYSGVLSLFDLDRSSDKGVEEVFSVQAHNGIVNCMDGIGGASVGHGAPEVVTGGRDGAARIWDPRVNYPVISLEPEKGSALRDCWTVSFGNSYNDEERCVLAGYDNGDVKLFDLRTQSVRWEKNCNNGITCAEFDRNDIEMNKVVVTSLESSFMCFDMRTQHSTAGFASITEKAHRSTIWLGRHLPHNRDIFMTGGGNGGFNIYKYHYPLNRVGKHEKDGTPIGVMGDVELLNSRVVSTQPIVCFDWSPDRAGLCCMGSLDQSLRYVYFSPHNTFHFQLSTCWY